MKNTKPAKRKPKSERKRLVAELDRTFSFFIRRRDGLKTGGTCIFDFCGGMIECCFHFITRAKHSVRWDERNAVGACASCNFTMEFNPHPFINWYISKHGLPAYQELFRDSNRIAKFSNDDLQTILDGIKSKMLPVDKKALTNSDN